MTLTIKDSPELTGMAKPGSTAQNTENANGQSPRSNPVCLEVPVAIRSLPGEKSNGAGASGPMREEGRSVIVFDNGGVLRMTNPLPPGQTVILSNHHGRDVVCRVVGGRNLPNIKGYIEVEFIEPVNDFWQIHPPAEPARVPSPEEPEASSGAVEESPAAAAPEAVPTALEPLAATPLAAAPPEPSPAALTPPPVAQVATPVVAVPPPPPPAVPAKESSARTSSGAPTFEDIAGLVRMPPTAGPQAKKLEKKYEKKSDPAGAPSSMAARDGSQQSPQEIAKVNPPTRPASSIFEIDPELAAFPASSTEVFASPAPAPAVRQPISNDFAGRSEQVLVPMTFASSSGSSEPRGRMPLVLGAAALVVAGLGGGYFYMHRGTVAVPNLAPSVAMASQPLAPPADARSKPEVTPISQPAAVQPPLQTRPQAAPQQTLHPVSVGASASPVATGPAPVDSSKALVPGNAAEAKQPDRAAARPQPIPNLKMSSPSSPVQKLVSLPDSAPLASVDVAPPSPAAGTAPEALTARAENQPAPPTRNSTGAESQTVRVAKLISSTRPVYPAMAKESKIQGHVVINVSIDEQGNVVAAKAASGPMFLRQAAVDAVKHWKYSPALIDGKPAASQTTVDLDFRLN